MAPAPRFLPVVTACIAVAGLGVGLAQILVRR
jgi:hypothetical protein